MNPSYIDKQKLVAMLREASQTKRCHTMPIHGQYTVGQHSFDMCTLLLALYPDCRKELMVAAIAHDLPERWVGDMPAPTKWSLGGEAIKQLDRVEEDILRKLGLDVSLTPEERLWLHGLDRVELLLWTKEQVAMGNSNVCTMLAALAVWFQKHELPLPLKEFVEQHKWTRTGDILP